MKEAQPLPSGRALSAWWRGPLQRSCAHTGMEQGAARCGDPPADSRPSQLREQGCPGQVSPGLVCIQVGA